MHCYINHVFPKSQSNTSFCDYRCCSEFQMATEHFLTYPIILLALDIWIFYYKEILGELSCTNIFLTCPVPSRGDSGGQGIFFKDF